MHAKPWYQYYTARWSSQYCCSALTWCQTKYGLALPAHIFTTNPPPPLFPFALRFATQATIVWEVVVDGGLSALRHVELIRSTLNAPLCFLHWKCAEQNGRLERSREVIGLGVITWFGDGIDAKTSVSLSWVRFSGYNFKHLKMSGDISNEIEETLTRSKS